MSHITLSHLLASREQRSTRQAELLRQFPSRVLVCLTVMLPGDVKRDGRSLRIASEGVNALRSAFDIDYEEIRDLETGFEGFFTVEGTAEDVKRRCCMLEDTLPLGRLMDIDVILDRDGAPAPLGRRALGLEERSCLLCARPARECMRARRHSHDDLMRKIDKMLEKTANL